MTKITILGAGLAGLSCSFHLGHERCVIFEKKSYAGGHIYSHRKDGCIWDEGPHVSFTKHEYVRKLFEQSVQTNILEFESIVSNYYKKHWIPHPAQSNLYAIPEPLRSNCLSDFLKTRNEQNQTIDPTNYGEWLRHAFGDTFSENFPKAYTKKYWTCDPSSLSTDWVGSRVFYPDIQTVVDGSTGPAKKKTHYINSFRYPEYGGFISFANILSKKNANIYFNREIKSIDLRAKKIFFDDDSFHCYDRLINTIPLPTFIGLIPNVPIEIQRRPMP